MQCLSNDVFKPNLLFVSDIILRRYSWIFSWFIYFLFGSFVSLFVSSDDFLSSLSTISPTDPPITSWKVHVLSVVYLNIGDLLFASSSLSPHYRNQIILQVININIKSHHQWFILMGQNKSRSDWLIGRQYKGKNLSLHTLTYSIAMSIAITTSSTS